MTKIRLVISVLVLLCAAYVVVMNWACAIASVRNKIKRIDKHHSMVPLVSFFVAILGAAIYPYEEKTWIAIIPLADVSLWNLLLIPFYLIRLLFKEKARQNKPPP